MKSLLAFCILALVALTGCSQKHAVDTLQTPPIQLSRDASFYVVMPRDGQYGGKSYAGSGRSTAAAVVAAFAACNSKTVQGETPEDLSAAMSKAKDAGLAYVVASGKVVASTVARASSKWATFGGDHPQDLLPKPTQDFVAQLF